MVGSCAQCVLNWRQLSLHCAVCRFLHGIQKIGVALGRLLFLKNYWKINFAGVQEVSLYCAEPVHCYIAEEGSKCLFCLFTILCYLSRQCQKVWKSKSAA